MRLRIVWLTAFVVALLLSIAGWLFSQGPPSTSVLDEVAGTYSPLGPTCDSQPNRIIRVRSDGLSDATGQINPSELDFYHAEKFFVRFEQGYNSEFRSDGTTWYFAYSHAPDGQVLLSAFTQILPSAVAEILQTASPDYKHRDSIRVFYYRNALFDHEPSIEEILKGEASDYDSYTLLFPCTIGA